MENELNTEAQEPKLPFSASRREIAAAFLMYVVAYLYTGWDERLWPALFTVGFIALTELVHFEKSRAKESFVWLGCVLVILICILFPALSLSSLFGFADTRRVWHEGDSIMFLHIFAVYWVLARGGTLAGGESGRLLPLDGINGFILFPFGHFFLRIRTVAYGIRKLAPKKGGAKPAAIAGGIIAALVAIGLFIGAASLLTKADSGFGSFAEKLIGNFRLRLKGEFWGRFILSLPVGAYLYGLIGGSGREEPERLRETGGKLISALDSLRKVPEWVWTAAIALFSLLYLAFFVMQGTYLFGAFTRTLPEGFIVSRYAREGFFELCKVMAVNFALLWLVTRSSSRPVGENRPLAVMCCALLAESMVFAVIAFSKLWLYIDCFGFTPLRLESCWLVITLLAGCVCSLITLLTRKKTMRLWMIFGAVTLTLLHLY